MPLKTLKIFFCLGLVMFAAGVALVFGGNEFRGIGLLTLGIMWAFISFGQIQALKRK